ncbi:MAG: putative glycolipid-binding domain-containing protein [Egibacteraceae bacterium]
MTVVKWEQHRDHARRCYGLELLRLVPEPSGGWRAEGHVVAGDEAGPWALRYVVLVDEAWRTRHVDLCVLGPDGSFQRSLVSDGAGNWLVDGRVAPELAGCLDVDLGASLFTNTLPIRRLGLNPDEAADPAAVWVGMPELATEVLRQRYTRIGEARYRYEVPESDFVVDLTTDEQGLVLDYPGLGTRVS